MQQPRMIVEVADHDLIMPSERTLINFDQLAAWVKTFDYDEVDGAVVSLDGIPGMYSGREQIELIKQIRFRRPEMPIYGFITFSENTNQIAQLALDLVADESLTFLLISHQDKQNEDQRKSMQARLAREIESRRLGDKVGLNDDPDTATVNLLARMINHRFGFIPKIMPVYSSGAGRDAVVAGYGLPLHQLVVDKIGKAGGVEVPQTSEGARNVDVLLFIHTAQTPEQDRVAFIETIAQTIDRNVRIALVDLSQTRESRDAVMAELRRRKLLDRLASYAALDPETERAGEAVARALAHSAAFLVSIRFLRDDLERVRRFDRAQVSLLLSRYLTDWAFPLSIRPKLPPFLRDQPTGESLKPRQNAETAETFVLNELKLVAEELFNDQFKRNIRGFLLSNGERTQFEVRLIQRLLSRLYLRADSPQTAEVEVRPAIYLVHLGNVAVPQLRSNKIWRLYPDGLDERVGRRWDAIDWGSFKTDAERVEMNIDISAKPGKSGAPLDSIEGYTIVSKRSRENRRIDIAAATNQGAFYALGKLEQMGAEGGLAQDFQINEKPAVAGRGVIEHFSDTRWSHRDRTEMLRFLGRMRMNRYYYIPGDKTDRNQGQMEKENDKVKELLRIADENFVQLVYGIRVNPTNLPMGDQGFASVVSEVDRLAALGVKRFALYFDNAPEEARTNLIARVRDYLKRFGEVELSTTPKAPSETWSICFNPNHSARATPDQNPLSFNTRATGQSHAAKLPIATAAEYAWYGSSYQPERSFSSVMNLLFDERSRAGVRVWSQLLGDCHNDGNPLAALFNEQSKNAGANDANRELIAQKLGELQAALEMIGGTRERGLLRGELAQFIKRAQAAIENSSVTKRGDESRRQSE
jgi:hypothetical protein